MLASFLIGAAAGHRSAMPLAILALDHRQERPWTAAAATLAAAGELVADKHPAVPARVDLVPATARLATGGFAGAMVRRSSSARAVGAVAGTAGAAFGTWAGFRLRAILARRIGRDLPAALIEDATAAGVSLFALRLAR